MADAKQGKTLEDFCNGSSSQSRVVLAKPRLGGFGASTFASSSNKSCNPFGSVLRPSQLKPGCSPFLKVTETSVELAVEKEQEPEQSSSEDRLTDAKEGAEAPKFVPLGGANVTPRTSNPVPAPAQPATSSSSSGFIFGQNLSERVVIKENVNNGEAGPVDHSSTNGTAEGTTELLFTSAAASVKENNQEEAGPSDVSSTSSGSSLAASAAEYERSHARPPPPAASYSLTGEEGEINVLQISCRLFAWEAGSWRERGRGVLRLNDAEAGGGAGGGAGAGAGAARLVARVSGSLRVVLNTKLWPDMVVERAGTKSLRITAADAQQQIKLFLIMGAPVDIVQLYRALTARIASSKRTNTCAQNATSQQAAERLEAAAQDDFLDKPDDDLCNQEEGFAHKPTDEPNPEQDRLEQTELPDKTDEQETHVDDDDTTKPLKRKEPTDDDTPPKRQCPQILIE